MIDRLVNWKSLEPREVIPGFHGRFAHSERMTFVLWEIEEGAILPEHDHEHEQVVNLLCGRFELTVDGVSTVLQEVGLSVIPSWARHSGIALSNCRILDVFAPVREDYKAGGVGGILQMAAGGR